MDVPIPFDLIKIIRCWTSQNDCQIPIFVKPIHIVGEIMTRKIGKMVKSQSCPIRFRSEFTFPHWNDRFQNQFMLWRNDRIKVCMYICRSIEGVELSSNSYISNYLSLSVLQRKRHTQYIHTHTHTPGGFICTSPSWLSVTSSSSQCC